MGMELPDAAGHALFLDVAAGYLGLFILRKFVKLFA